MRTQIIHLDAHDDHVSARDKMGWTQTQRIILVWPDTGVVLDKRLDLILLKRHSHTLGAELAIVAPYRKVIQNAKDLGIPAYRTLARAKRSNWQKDSPTVYPYDPIYQKLTQTKFNNDQKRIDIQSPDRSLPFEITNPLIRHFVFVLGVIAVTCMAAVFVPNSEIHIKTATYPQELSMALSAGTDIKTVSITGEIPTETASIIVEGRASIPTTGTTLYPSTYAEGRALLTNLSENPITLEKGSIFRSSDDPQQRYETIKSITMAPGGEDRVQSALHAISPGASSNLQANSILILEGPESTSIIARNQLPLSGGKDIIVPAVELVDQRKLYRILEQQLRQSALEDFIEDSTGTYQVITPTLVVKEVIHEEYFPLIGQPANQVDLELQLEYEVQTLRYDTVVDLIQQVMDTRSAMGFTAVDSSLQIHNIGEFSLNDKGNFSWKIKAERNLTTQIEANDVAIASLGLAPPNAISILMEKYALSEAPEIILSPEWWPRMPLLPFRIEVIINRTNQLGSSKISRLCNRM